MSWHASARLGMTGMRLCARASCNRVLASPTLRSGLPNLIRYVWAFMLPLSPLLHSYYAGTNCLISLLRRVALQLGVSTAGDKAKILANIREYVPRTFSLSLFAVGPDYDAATIDRITARLLSADPSRRQPEATF